MFRDFQVLGFQGSGIWRFRHFGGPGLSLDPKPYTLNPKIIESCMQLAQKSVDPGCPTPYTTLINVNPDP